MKAQHTPGPWSIDPEGSIAVTIEGGNGEPICDVYGANKEADAYLIAAAPDLLEALEECRKLLEFLPLEYVHKGRFDPLTHSPDGALAKAIAAIAKATATH